MIKRKKNSIISINFNKLHNIASSKTTDLAACILVIVFTVIYSFMALNNHRLFETNGWDLSIFDQGVWQWSNFKFPYSSFHDLPWLADHFHPILIIFAPLYRILPDVRVLITVQSVVICLGAIPLYYLSKKVTKDRLFSLVLVLAYLTYYSLQWSVFSPFHEIAFLPLMLGSLLYFWETKNTKFYWISFAVALLIKEEVGFLLAAIGLWELVNDRKRWRQAILTAIMGLAASLVVIGIIMPLIGGGFYRHSGYGQSGNSLSEVFVNIIKDPVILIKSLYDSPVKIHTVITSFWPWGFLPIFAPSTLMPVLQQFLFRFLDYGKTTRWLPYTYSLPLATLMAWGSIYAYRNIFKTVKKWINITPIIFSLIISFLLFSLVVTADIKLHEPINSIFKKAFYRTEGWMLDNLKAIKCVPENASLSSQNSLAPRLSQRSRIKVFPEGLSSSYDYIIVDLHRGQSENSFHFLGREKTVFLIDDLVKRNLYRNICKYNDAMVLERVGDVNGKLNYPFELDIYEK